jgi:hypothetical protein
MQYTNFPQAYEKKLGAGDNPNTGDLAFCRAVDHNTPDRVFIISCWEPSEEELARIIQEKKVYLGVMSRPDYPTQTPVFVTGINPLVKDTSVNFDDPLTIVQEGGRIPVTSDYYSRIKGKDQEYNMRVAETLFPNDKFFGIDKGPQVDKIISDVNEIISEPKETIGAKLDREHAPTRDSFTVEKNGNDFNVKTP